jgi:hypothetical protein
MGFDLKGIIRRSQPLIYANSLLISLFFLPGTAICANSRGLKWLAESKKGAGYFRRFLTSCVSRTNLQFLEVKLQGELHHPRVSGQ